MFLKRSRLFWGAVLCALCMGVNAAQDVVLMRVGDVQVTNRDVLAELQRIPPESRAAALAKPGTVQVILKTLMVRRLLAQEAQSSGLADTPDLRELRKINDERVLSDARMLQIDAGAEPDQAALEAYARATYQAEPARFQRPAQTHARHILITGDGDKAKATLEKLRAELKDGASFEKLAAEYSQDPGSAKKGGDLGFFAEGRMVPEFDTALKALTKPGEVSEPVQTKFGWHLIELVERRPQAKLPYEEVRDALYSQARVRILSEKRVAKSGALIKDAEYEDDAIKAFLAAEKH